MVIGQRMFDINSIKVDKTIEKELLLRRIFPAPYAGYESTLPLFIICRELGDSYCLKFNEKGYTKNYQRFDSEEVIKRVSKLISDEQLLYYAKKFEAALNTYSDFKGKYYTYDHKTKQLKIGSKWKTILKTLNEFFNEYGKNGEAVLRAIFEVNVKHDKRWKNFWLIHTLAKKYGLVKGWYAILSELELIGIITRHKGDIWIPDELIPLIKHVIYALQKED